MSGWSIIEIALSLILVYFLTSVLVSSIVELLKILTNSKSKHYERELRDSLGEDLAEQILNHPAARLFSKKGITKISPKSFVRAALDSQKNDRNGILGGRNWGSPADPQEGGETPNQGESDPAAQLEAQQAEQWYNDFLQQVSQSYKFKLRIPTLIVAIAVTVLVNIDTLSIARSLYEDPQLRSQVIALSEELDFQSFMTADSLNLTESQAIQEQMRRIRKVQQQLEDLKEMGLPLGWKSCEDLGICLPKETRTLQLTFQEIAKNSHIPAIQKDSAQQHYQVWLPIQEPSEALILSTAQKLTAKAQRVDTTFPSSSAKTWFNVRLRIDTFREIESPSESYFQFAGMEGPAHYFDASLKTKPDLGQQKFLFEPIFANSQPHLFRTDSGLQLQFAFGKEQDRIETAKAELKSISQGLYTFEVELELASIHPGGLAVISANLALVNSSQILGWILTIIACMMGAPFWYDLFQKLTGKPE